MISTDELAKLVLIGVGATAVVDVWSMAQRALGIATLDYAMVGRWSGYFLRGQFTHSSIAKAAPVPGERLLGWMIHYAVGIAFAGLLVSACRTAWLHDPTWLPALTVGLATVAIPFFVMQPAMGAGIAASRTPAPWMNRLRSLLTHIVFGSGLYLSAVLLNRVLK